MEARNRLDSCYLLVRFYYLAQEASRLAWSICCQISESFVLVSLGVGFHFALEVASLGPRPCREAQAHSTAEPGRMLACTDRCRRQVSRRGLKLNHGGLHNFSDGRTCWPRHRQAARVSGRASVPDAARHQAGTGPAAAELQARSRLASDMYSESPPHHHHYSPGQYCVPAAACQRAKRSKRCGRCPGLLGGRPHANGGPPRHGAGSTTTTNPWPRHGHWPHDASRRVARTTCMLMVLDGVC